MHFERYTFGTFSDTDSMISKKTRSGSDMDIIFEKQDGIGL